MNVLLVDDEAAVRKLMSITLREGGFQVIEASNAAQALALFHRHPIDVLVTDILMEEMDGIALAIKVMAHRPDLPVLFVSGCGSEFERAPQQHSRCEFLAKPFLPHDLTNCVSKLASSANPS
jgi:two-component system response regulator GlrR